MTMGPKSQNIINAAPATTKKNTTKTVIFKFDGAYSARRCFCHDRQTSFNIERAMAGSLRHGGGGT